LHLAGSGKLDVPVALKNIIVFHTDLNYFQFYDLMSTMDICIPAFPNTDEYFEMKASSTPAMCLESDVSLLFVPYPQNPFVTSSSGAPPRDSTHP
jgi:hypothetical protein